LHVGTNGSVIESESSVDRTNGSVDRTGGPVGRGVLRLIGMPAHDLSMLLRVMRGKATQDEFGALVGLSGKTLSRWELRNRHPTRGQRIELLLALRDSGRFGYEELAELARVSGLDPADHGVVPPQVSTRAPADAVRARVDAALLAAAESLDVSPRVLRKTVDALLAAADESGYSVAEVRAILAARASS
jgi:hypothetical protein